MKSRIVPGIIVLCVLGLAGWFVARNVFFQVVPERASTAPSGEITAAESPEILTLSPLKQQAAGIRLGAATRQLIRELATVPGRIQYDDTRHIEVKVPVAGILTDVRVQPGVEVAAGDVLAILSSPEVGTARADVLRRQVEFELAERKHAWKKSACEGLRKLVDAVEAGRSPQDIVGSLDTITLGAYREQVVSAYSRFRLADSLATAASSASSSGAIPERTIKERLSERDAAQAALQAITEQSLFEACQESATAKLEAQDAERRLRISRQTLYTFLGYDEDVDPTANENQLSLVEVRAPIDGTIERRTFSRMERIKQGDSLFVLANTSRLWVSADIREQEWAALRLKPGEELLLTSPALPDRQLISHVEFVGREVSPETNAVPLVAAINNADGLLRPGQFVWVQLPLGSARSAVTVPESAIVEHDGIPFVFISAGENRFQRVDITTGIRQGGLTEVLSGLQEHQQVVERGAFALKSELLLEREE